MVEINRHRFFLVQILKEIYSDLELSNSLGFKGGSALMFFYGLPRFSIDLDFNLIHQEKQDLVFEKVRKIILNYGKIHDVANKHFGPIIVLDYGEGERKLKVEISNRNYNDRYEMKNLLGIGMKVMIESDMFAHKLCALQDRNVLVARDIFDTWFFMNRKTPVNIRLIEERMRIPYQEYMQACIHQIEKMKENRLLHGLGELMSSEMKTFVRNELKTDTISLLKFYKDFPITSNFHYSHITDH